MKKLDTIKRDEIIRLFFYGNTYDEIVDRTGVGKGSVTNIIEEYRNGTLGLPLDIISYVDELRRVTVDLKKNRTNVASMKVHLKLQARILEMGVSESELERWLDMCRNIAHPDTSTEHFIQAALELSKLTESSGMNYSAITEDYEIKRDNLQNLQSEIHLKEAKLNLIKAGMKKKKEEYKELLSLLERNITCVSRDKPDRQPICVHRCSKHPGFYVLAHPYSHSRA